MTEGCVTHLLTEIEKIADDIETLYAEAKAAEATESILCGRLSDPYVIGYIRQGCKSAAGDLRERVKWMRKRLQDAQEDAAEALSVGGGVR